MSASVPPGGEDAGNHEGPPPGANARGEAGSLDSGPGLRLNLRVDVDGTIRGAGFELVDCESARVAARHLCGALLGATARDAGRTTVRAISSLGGATSERPYARMLHAALQAALRAWLVPSVERGSEIVCACFALERDSIIETIRRSGAQSVEELREHLPATRGCGTCRPDVEELLRRELESR